MNDTPDDILPPTEIGPICIGVDPIKVASTLVLQKQGRHLIRVHPDLRVELVAGATIREALTVLVQAASMGNAHEGVPEALADEIIRMAREDRDE